MTAKITVDLSDTAKNSLRSMAGYRIAEQVRAALMSASTGLRSITVTIVIGNQTIELLIDTTREITSNECQLMLNAKLDQCHHI